MSTFRILDIIKLCSLLICAQLAAASTYYPGTSFQVVDEEIEVQCYNNGFTDEKVLSYPTRSFSKDSLNADQITVSFWMRFTHKRLAPSTENSILLYFTNDITNDQSTDFIIGVGLDSSYNPVFYYQSQTLVQSPATSLFSTTSINSWEFYVFSAQVVSLTQVQANLFSKTIAPINTNSVSFTPAPSLTTQAFFTSKFDQTGGFFLGSSLKYQFASVLPSCSQFRQVQIQMNSYVVSGDSFLDTMKQSPSKLILHLSFQSSDQFQSPSTSTTYFLRDLSSQENHVFLATQLTTSPPAGSSIPLQISASIPLQGFSFREGFTISYWVDLSVSTLTTFSFDMGTSSKEGSFSIKHLGTSVSFEQSSPTASTNNFSFSPSVSTTGSWNFILLTFSTSLNQAILYLLDGSNVLQASSPITFYQTPKISNFVRITIGSSSQAPFTIQDFKVLSEIQIFDLKSPTYSLFGQSLTSSCLISYGASSQSCLLCKNMPIRNGGQCVKSCSDFHTFNGQFSKCLQCQIAPSSTFAYEKVDYYQSTRSYVPAPASQTITISSSSNILLTLDLTLSISTIPNLSLTTNTNPYTFLTSITSLKQYTFTDSYFNSGIKDFQTNSPIFVRFNTPYQTIPKVLISLISSTSSATAIKLVLFEISTRGFTFQYSQASVQTTIISWVAMPYYMETTRGFLKSGDSNYYSFSSPMSDFYQTLLPNINQIYTLESFFVATTTNIGSTITTIQNQLHAYTKQSIGPNAQQVGIQIGYIFEAKKEEIICTQLAAANPFPLINNLPSVIQINPHFNFLHSLQPPMTGQLNQAPQVFFALKNFDTSQIFQLSPQILSRQFYSSPTTLPSATTDQELYVFSTLSYSGKVVTDIFTIPIGASATFIKVFNEELLTIQGIAQVSIVGWQTINPVISITSCTVTTTTSITILYTSNVAFDAQIIFLPQLNGLDYQLKPNPTGVYTYGSNVIFGVYDVSLTDEIQFSSTTLKIVNSKAKIWIIEGLTPKASLPDNTCTVRRTSDFRCLQCKNPLLFTRDSILSDSCTCPLGFGFNTVTNKCVRCQLGCLSCRYYSKASYNSMECWKCDTEQNFIKSGDRCKCKDGFQLEKDSPSCIPDLSTGKTLPSQFDLSDVGPFTSSSSIRSYGSVTQLVATRRFTIATYVQLDALFSSTTPPPPIDIIYWKQTAQGYPFGQVSLLLQGSSRVLQYSSKDNFCLGGTALPPVNYPTNADDQAYFQIAKVAQIYASFEYNLDLRWWVAVYLPEFDRWMQFGDIKLNIVLMSNFNFVSTITFSQFNKVNNYVSLDSSALDQKELYKNYFKPKNTALHYFTVADSKYSNLNSKYIIPQSTEVLDYEQYGANGYDDTNGFNSKFALDTVFLSVDQGDLDIDYTQLQFGVIKNQEISLTQGTVSPSPTPTGNTSARTGYNTVVSFWVKAKATIKNENQSFIISTIDDDKVIIGNMKTIGNVLQIIVCITNECKVASSYVLDSQSWNQMTFVFEVSLNAQEIQTIKVRAGFKNLFQNLYFNTLPTSTPSTMKFKLGNVLNTNTGSGYSFNYVNILDGSFIKFNNLDPFGTQASYCSVNAGKFKTFCLKCKMNYPKQNQLCSPLATSQSCTFDLVSKPIILTVASSIKYGGRDPYLYIPEFDVCERCIVSRCSNCYGSIDNCLNSCSNQCTKCPLTPSNCTVCRGGRKTEPTCNNCPDSTGTVDDGVSEFCRCEPQCSTCSISVSNCLQCKTTTSTSVSTNRKGTAPYCECSLGFFDTSKEICSTCNSSKCSRCSVEDDFCLTCVGNRINAPTCDCPLYYTEPPLAKIASGCVQCLTNCVNCLVSPSGITSDNCTLCRLNSHWDPTTATCVCDSGYYSDSSLSSCQRCGMLCLTCSSKSKCSTCKGTRIVNSAGKCVCPNGQYGKSYLVVCNPCDITCMLCSGPQNDQCLACYSDQSVRLRKGKCVCPNTYYYNTNAKICLITMKVQKNWLEYNEDIQPYFHLNFTDIVTSSGAVVMSALTFDITGLTVHKDFEPVLQVKTSTLIKVILNLFVSFRPTELIVTITNPSIIQDSYFAAMDSSYQNYEMKFDLLPNHLVNSNQLSYLKSMRSASKIMYFQEGYAQDFAWLIQLFAFQNFLLNSLQPTTMLLLYNQFMPISVYETLRAFSILHYQNVPVWGDFEEKDTMILRKHSAEIAASQHPGRNLGKMGISGSFLINFLRITFLYSFLWIGFYLVRLRFLNEKYREQGNRVEWIEHLYQGSMYFISKLTESFFLILSAIALTQIQEPNFSGAFNGISYLINFLFLGALIGILYFIFEQLRQCDLTDEEQRLKVIRALGNMTFDLRITESKLVKYYHLITYSKKFLYTIFIVYGSALNENQILAVLIIECIFFCFQTGLQPFDKIMYFVLKTGLQVLYIAILSLTYYSGRKWIEMTEKSVIINQGEMDKYYQVGRALSFMILIYNIGNLIVGTFYWFMHFWKDFQGVKRDQIRKKAFGDLSQKQQLYNYQELVDYDVVKKRESLFKVIDLQDSRKTSPLPTAVMEKEIEGIIYPYTEEQLNERKADRTKKLKDGGKYEICLRKDIIWRNFVDPVRKTYTIAAETIETFSAKKSANPIHNEIETNVNVDYSNPTKTVYKQGQEEFRVLASLLTKWKVPKTARILREVTIVVNTADYNAGEQFDLISPLKTVSYYSISSKYVQ